MIDAVSHELVVPVLVEGWQYECCGIPPEVGARVAWRLDLDLDIEGWPEAEIDLTYVSEPVASDVLEEWRGLGNGVGPSPVLLCHGGLVVYLPDGDLVADAAFRGVLREDHHVDVPTDVPTTTGTIDRVRLVSREYSRSGRIVWSPLPGTEELTDVSAAPPSLPHTEPAEGAERWRSVSDVLVDLRVDPIPG